MLVNFSVALRVYYPNVLIFISVLLPIIIISLFAVTPLQVLAIQRRKKKKKKKKQKKKKEQSRNTLQSTRPQNYVQCKLTEDTSLHCQMRYPKLGCFTVYLLGRKRVTMILNSNIIIQFTVGLIQKELKGFN